MDEILIWLDLEAHVPSDDYAALRLWRCLRTKDRDTGGDGHLSADDVEDVRRALRISTRTLRRHLQAGNQVYWRWQRHTTGDVFLIGYRAVCEHYGIVPAQGKPKRVPIAKIRTLGQFRALCASSKLRYLQGGRTCVEISREQLAAYLAVTRQTLARYIAEGWITSYAQVVPVARKRVQAAGSIQIEGVDDRRPDLPKRKWKTASGETVLVNQQMNLYASWFDHQPLSPDFDAGIDATRVRGAAVQVADTRRIPLQLDAPLFDPTQQVPQLCEPVPADWSW